MSLSTKTKLYSQQTDEDSQNIEVIVEVRGDRKTKHLVIVRQALGIKDGRLVLVGPKKEERVLTFEWISNRPPRETEPKEAILPEIPQSSANVS